MSGIPPVKPVENYDRERSSSSGVKKNGSKSIDEKVQRLILIKIHDSSPLLLYVSVTAQDIVASFVSHICHPKKPVNWGRNDKGRKRKPKNESTEKLVSIRL